MCPPWLLALILQVSVTTSLKLYLGWKVYYSGGQEKTLRGNGRAKGVNLCYQILQHLDREGKKVCLIK
jgi:hypothetical protein